MKINQVMSTNVVVTDPCQSVENVAKLMYEHNIGSVPVCEHGTVHGVLTDRDIVLRCVAAGRNAATLKAHEIMTSGAVYTTPQADVSEALHLMSGEQVRRLPVVQNGKIQGIVSIADIARSQAGPELSEAISDISRPC